MSYIPLLVNGQIPPGFQNAHVRRRQRLARERIERSIFGGARLLRCCRMALEVVKTVGKVCLRFCRPSQHPRPGNSEERLTRRAVVAHVGKVWVVCGVQISVAILHLDALGAGIVTGVKLTLGSHVEVVCDLRGRLAMDVTFCWGARGDV